MIYLLVFLKSSNLQKDKEGVKGMNEEHRAIDCMAQHIRTFLMQSSEGRKADYGEPCESCERLKECNFDWLSIMDPLLKKSNVKIRVVL